MIEFLIGIAILCGITKLLVKRYNNMFFGVFFGLFFGAISGGSNPDYARCAWEFHDEISPDCPKEVYSREDVEYWFGTKDMGNGIIQVQEYCKSCRKVYAQWKEKDVFGVVELPLFE